MKTVSEICKQNFEQPKSKTYCTPAGVDCFLKQICNRSIDSRVPEEIEKWENDLNEAIKLNEGTK